MRKKIAILVAVGIIGLVFLGCGPLNELIATSTPTHTPTSTPTPTPTHTPTSTPTPTPTPTPPVEARIDVPVSDGYWQVIVREVGRPRNAQMGNTTWTPNAGYQFITVESHYRLLTPGFGGMNVEDAALQLGRSRQGAIGIGIGNEYCAGCRGLGFLRARGNTSGDSGYLFNVDDAWEIEEMSYTFLAAPEVSLTEADWMPTTRIPALLGSAPLNWGPPAEMPAAGKLTYASGFEDGRVVLWSLEGDGANAAQIPFGDMAYGWAKYSPDGQRLLILIQPSVGWMSLYLSNADGSASLPLALDAEWINATFSLDGRHLFFSVLPINDDEERLYVADADGANAREVTSAGVLDFASSTSGNIVLVTSEYENRPFFLALDANNNFHLWPLQARLASESAYAIDPAGKKVRLLVEDIDYLRAYAGGRLALIAEEPTGTDEKDRLVLWDLETGEDTRLRDDGSGGWGCVAPDDSYVITVMNITRNETTIPRILLTPTDDPEDKVTLLDNAKLSSGFEGCQFSSDGEHMWIIVNTPTTDTQSEPTLFILNRDGDILERIGKAVNAQFSPDGSRLAYTVEAREGRYKLYLADADGGNPQQVGDGLLTGWAGGAP